MQVEEAFSSSYRQAREKFLQAAKDAGLAVKSYLHPERGRDGEELAMDVALDGNPDADKLLIVSSGCHGVEGYCGTGVQVFALHDAQWRRQAKADGVAVLYVHALNPYGFSHIRRVTQENVDLNRNFHDFAGELPANDAYSEVHPVLLPPAWPPDAANQQALGSFIATRGMKALQAAMSGGQHRHPDGLFFGGREPTWSNRTFRQVLRDYAQKASRIAWIDLHTGLGPNGHGERIYAGRNDPATIARARKWWGSGQDELTSIYDGSSTSAPLTGMAFAALYDECPQAEYTGIAMEYGTQPMEDVMAALRGDHWLHNHPEAPPQQHAEIKRKLMDAFYTDTPEWRQRIVEQARASMLQASSGLSSS